MGSRVLKNKVLPKKMPVTGKLASRVRSYIGEPEECVKCHKENCSEKNGVSKLVTSLGNIIHGFDVKDASRGGVKWGGDRRTSHKSENSWVREDRGHFAIDEMEEK